MTCTCTDLGLGNAGPMLNGLGQIDPVSAGVAIDQAYGAFQDLLNALGVGAGRHEADIIVPVQNQIFNGTITPIVDYLTGIKNGTIQGDCTTLRNDLNAMNSVKAKWFNFLDTTNWPDGRAAQQAHATLDPWFTNTIADINNRIATLCGTSGITSIIPSSIGQLFTTPTGQTNWPMVVGAAGLIYLVVRKK